MIVYYFGDRYYWKSATMMGPLYTADGQRYDWGVLQRDVERGVEVTVRKATPQMIEWADQMLKEQFGVEW
jgi:hypothetical protein